MVRLIKDVVYTTKSGVDMTIGCEFSESADKEKELVNRGFAEYVNKPIPTADEGKAKKTPKKDK